MLDDLFSKVDAVANLHVAIYG